MKYARSTLVQRIGDLVEYLIAVALIGAPLVGLLALMVICMMDNQERAAFVAWKHRNLFLISICSLPFLINIPHLKRFIRERHLLRKKIARASQLEEGRLRSILKSAAIIWTPACALGIIALIGGAIVQAWPIDAVKGIVGVFFLLIWSVFAVWVFVGWSVYAHEPENEREVLTANPAPPSRPSPTAAPQTKETLSSSEQAIRILARSIYRELKGNGYSREQIIAIVVALIELTQKEIERSHASTG